MSNYLSILKKALGDPKLDDLTCICPSDSPSLTRLLKNLPSDVCISEWRYGMGDINYEYHIHVDGIATQLRNAFERGARGGHPKLTAVYSKEELKNLILSSKVGSEY